MSLNYLKWNYISLNDLNWAEMTSRFNKKFYQHLLQISEQGKNGKSNANNTFLWSFL